MVVFLTLKSTFRIVSLKEMDVAYSHVVGVPWLPYMRARVSMTSFVTLKEARQLSRRGLNTLISPARSPLHTSIHAAVKNAQNPLGVNRGVKTMF